MFFDIYCIRFYIRGENSNEKRAVLSLLVVMCIGINCGTVYAQTVSKEKTIGNKVYYASLTTSEEPMAKKPIYATQAAHKKGIKTTIGVDEAKTTSVSASVDVTAGFNFIDTLQVKLGVTQSCSYTVTAKVSYELNKQKSGKYRIEVWYPGKVETLKLKWKEKGTTKYYKTITKSLIIHQLKMLNISNW